MANLASPLGVNFTTSSLKEITSKHVIQTLASISIPMPQIHMESQRVICAPLSNSSSSTVTIIHTTVRSMDFDRSLLSLPQATVSPLGTSLEGWG